MISFKDKTSHDPDRWSSCSFRVTSSKLSAEEISVALGAQPTSSKDKSDLKSPHSPELGKRDFSVWILDSGISDTDSLDRHFEVLMSFINSRIDKIRLLSKECSFDFSCSFSSGSGQGGIMIEHEILKVMGNAGIDIMINLFPPE